MSGPGRGHGADIGRGQGGAKQHGRIFLSPLIWGTGSLRPREPCSQNGALPPASLPSETFCRIHEVVTQCAGRETLIVSLYLK